MNASRLVQTLFSAVCLSLAILFISSCSNSPQDRFQGYVEGEFVYVASPLAGQLESLQVRRGDQVKTGDPLFALDETAEKAALDRRGRRWSFPKLSSRDRKNFSAWVPLPRRITIGRVRRATRTGSALLRRSGISTRNDRRRHRPVWFTTRFFAKANGWRRENRWSSLLPPQNIKVRAFVPETQVGSIHYGDTTRVTVDGVPNPFIGKVSYISPHAEYTPPVIYSRESRAKLVFMIESVFDPEVSANLHPGQPVDVEFRSK